MTVGLPFLGFIWLTNEECEEITIALDSFLRTEFVSVELTSKSLVVTIKNTKKKAKNYSFLLLIY